LQRLWQGIGWFGAGVVIFLTLTPKPPPMPSVLDWDKAQHMLAYAVLMWWFRQAFARRMRWVVFLLLLGVGLECIQGLSAYRYFDYGDMIANTLGVILGLVLAATPLGRALAWFEHCLNSKRYA
jgi:hypothetical protein